MNLLNLLAKNLGAQSPKNAITNKAGAVYILGVIVAEWGADANGLLKALADIGRVDNLAVHINSPGGDVFEARAMGAILRATKANITVHVDGLAASAASELALNLGGKVIMSKGSFLMIHNASTMVWGNKEAMRKTADTLEKVDQSIANVYAEKTGQTADEIAALMNAETWLSADEAIASGWVNAVEGESDKANTNFDLTEYSNAPNSLQKKPEQPNAMAKKFAENERRARLALAA